MRVMKSLGLVLIILALLSVVASEETTVADDGCTWRYKCCEFETIDGAVTCERMCEPERDCSTTEAPVNQEEAVEGEFVVKPAVFAFSMNANHICRQGYRLNSKGQCKRVLGAAVETTTSQVPPESE